MIKDLINLFFYRRQIVKRLHLLNEKCYHPKNCFKPLVGVICRTGIVNSHKLRGPNKFRLTPCQIADIFSP